ncbi:MAG TPA: branched-chain amino acid ABC transporter permease [Acidimicrobiales bacterium]|nr:branched-chain amino acid ABC transporter permease [Acidimicrobiales bacterium]
MTWANAVVQGVLLGGLFALFATGLSLAFGVMRFVNLAHGDLAILAAFLAVSTTATLDVNPFVSLLVIVPGFALGGYVLQRFVFNRTMGPDPLPSILVTFGLGVVIQNALLEHYSADSRGLDAGAIETRSATLTDDISIGWFPLLTLVVAVAVLVALQLVLSRTRAGRAFRATADDPATARLMGIDDRAIYARIMAIAFATVALAGVFLGIRQTFGPSDGPTALIFGFEAVVIGGLGSLWGTLVGGVILGVAQTVGNQVDVRYDLLSGTLYGHLIFLAVLAFRPHGLLGRKGRA